MFETGKAYEVNFPREMRVDLSRRSSHFLKAKTILCPISKGECPYGNEGPRMIYCDAEDSEVSVCMSDGLIEKMGLLNVGKKPERKIERDKFRAF